MALIGVVNALPYYVDPHAGEEIPLSLKDPLIGSSASFFVPGGYAYQFMSVQCVVQTDATVGNRVIRVDLFDGLTDVTFMPSILSATASTGFGHLWSREVSAAYTVSPGFGVNPIFPNMVFSSQEMRITTQFSSGGDHISQVSATVIRYPTSLQPEQEMAAALTAVPLLT